MPFKPPAPGSELVRTMQTPVLNPRLGETEPLGDGAIAKAVAALPFAGSTVGAAVVQVPRLSLENYASLRAELEVSPERSADILRKYRVMNEAALRALDEHWQSEITGSPEVFGRFANLVAEYMAWLRRQRG